VAGVLHVDSASLSGLPGVTLAAEDLAIEFNTTGAAVPSTQVSVSDIPGDVVTIAFSDPHYNNFFGISGTANLTLSAPVSITFGGSFTFEVLGATPNQINVGFQNLHFDIKA